MNPEKMAKNWASYSPAMKKLATRRAKLKSAIISHLSKQGITLQEFQKALGMSVDTVVVHYRKPGERETLRHFVTYKGMKEIARRLGLKVRL